MATIYLLFDQDEMNGFKDKAQVFFLGLMLGLLVGGGFFILKLDDYFTTLSFYKTSNDNKAENKEVSTNPEPEKQLTKKQKSLKLVSAEANSLSDSLNLHSQPKGNSVGIQDSIATDSLAIVSNNDNIVVRKDELLSIKSVDMVNLNPVASRNSKDSVLSQLSGIKEDNNKVSYKIEFWQSPLNYKGYKMAKNKIALYGINVNDIIRLYKLDESIYLKHTLYTYRLEYTGDFRQFERITDESIVARLK